MSKIIRIFEGCDGVGKTTLIKSLYKPEQICHETSETSYKEQDIYDRLDHFDVFDRSFIGELVWSKVFNRKPRITLLQANAILRNKKYNFKIFIKHANFNIIHKNIKERGEKISYWPDDVFMEYIKILQFLEIDYEVINTWE